jgi:hypothetical protein
VGYLLAVIRVLRSVDHNELGIGLDFESADQTHRRTQWIESVGDWGYGIEMDGVATNGTWVQVFDGPIKPSMWLTGSPQLHVRVDSIKGQLVGLEQLEATDPSGAKVRTEDAAYLILSVDSNAVIFRQEVPSDAPCGDDAKAPPILPPSLRAPTSEFFNPDGSARFGRAYTRGC